MPRLGFVLRVVAMFALVAVIVFSFVAIAGGLAHSVPAGRLAAAVCVVLVAIVLLVLVARAHMRAAPPPKIEEADTLRNRLGSIGCGGVALLMAGLLMLVAIGGVLTGESTGSSIGGLIAGVLLAVIALLFWIRAVRSISGDDDLFTGTRGMALALILVLSLAILAGLIVTGINGDFWRGLFSGVQDAR